MYIPIVDPLPFWFYTGGVCSDILQFPQVTELILSLIHIYVHNYESNLLHNIGYINFIHTHIYSHVGLHTLIRRGILIFFLN